ncbi:aminotransferase class I/II-fold pyridoxal phosphate-dependent enzyme [Pseudemcibacter aquimaris]|uniref:aminotransferase class I/II-fold pyridoxal phosphate-dependent enzyme n=1 Tax=Pseudemcibacter aquimaris TaxID=2857064 RepID=UPI002012F6F1|nr:aminotransferase class I/II-fold pyridoxal phosphate-dependent enzyme [Pseudemcibacter aquimaris]MCC3859842.1 aminotransferase class I/II-fold pyridoxal phosphate-dependent enzyme [Pseudemcibacter aquimaris]WDU57174.1 aminotransferase class I/II-fold pyridoxal phosphate-dependent enzyme [Pseudemcibacter aquimaris]
MRNFELEVFFSKWEFKAKYHLTASDMESMSMADLMAMATEEEREGFNNLWLGYTETYGHPDLRTEIAKTYDTMNPENILCFAGAEEGIYTAMRTMLSKDDHAIVVVPNYQAAETLPLDICDVTGIPLDADNDWNLDIDKLIGSIKSNTKLISINFPNNPTGKIIPKSDLDKMIEVAREFGIYIFSDEVYRGIELDESKRLPQLADVYERGISLNVMSKAYGLPGLRIGWIACQDKELLGTFECYKHFLTICNSGPAEILSIIALRNRDKILERNKNLLSENLTKLDKFFAEFPDTFQWKRPDGGAVGYPKYLGDQSADEFCEELINETGVMLLPPRIYKSELLPTPHDHFRIGFGRSGMDEMLDVFYHYLKKNR